MTQQPLRPLRDNAAFLDVQATMPAPPRELRRYQHVLEQLPRRLLRGGEILSDRIQRAVDAWRWGDGSLVLLGSTGIGKTSGVVALISRLVSEAQALPASDTKARLAHSVLFTTAQKLAQARRETGLGVGRPSIVERACRVRLLALDDLGAEPQNDIELGAILDERYSEQRPIVVTSGLDKSQLALRYSAAFLRRLRETGRKPAVIVEDFRDPKKLRGVAT